MEASRDESLLRSRQPGQAALGERKDGGRRGGDVDVFSVVTAEDRDDLSLEASPAPFGIGFDLLADPGGEADRIGCGGIGSSEGLGGGHPKIVTMSMPDSNGERAAVAQGAWIHVRELRSRVEVVCRELIAAMDPSPP